MSSPDTRIHARLQMYCLIAEGFEHPSKHSLLYGSNQKYLAQLESASRDLFGQPLTVSPLDQDFEAVESDYIQLFLTGKSGKPMVGLHAGDYEEILGSQLRTELLLLYSNWYKHFGLAVRQDEDANELSDYIVCQFEFLAWLAKLQYNAVVSSTDDSPYELAQRDFLLRHLNPFFMLFFRKLKGALKKRKVSPLYGELAEMASVFLNRTLHELNSVASEAVGSFDPKSAIQQEQKVSSVDLWN